MSSGFGSSSALRLAVHTAFHLYLGGDTPGLWERARKAFRTNLSARRKLQAMILSLKKSVVLFIIKLTPVLCGLIILSLFLLIKGFLKRTSISLLVARELQRKRSCPRLTTGLNLKKKRTTFFVISDLLSESFAQFFSLGEKKNFLVSLMAQHRRFLKGEPFSSKKT